MEGHDSSLHECISPGVVQEFTEALVAGQRSGCDAIVQWALAQGAAPRDIYLGLFQASLYEVGSRWERGEVGVSVEHLATALVEELLARVYPHVGALPRNGRSAVVSCAADEFHQVGGRIVADTLEARGWTVWFLGANTPTAELAALVAARRPDLVALSVSIAAHLGLAAEAIDAVRKVAPEVPLVLGGQAFEGAGRELAGRAQGLHLMPSLEALEAWLAKTGG